MDMLSGALAVVGFFCGALGFVIYLDSPKQRTHVAYVVFIGSVISWIASILALRLFVDPEHMRLALAFAYASGTAIAVTFWYFVLFFTGRTLPTYHHTIVIGGALAIIALAFGSPDFIRRVIDAGNGNRYIILGPQHLYFIFYFAALMAASFGRLYQRYRASTDRNERGALMMVFMGTFATAVIGSALNIILVQLGNAKYIGLGPLSTIIMVSFIALAIVRNHFMRIRVIGAELFTIALVAALFSQAIFTNDPFLRAMNVLGIVLATGFGTFLIRSVKNEIQQNEHMHKMTESLQEANARLQELGRMKSQFLSFASHQIKAPLAAIKWQAQLFTDGSLGKLPATAIKTAHDIELSADQLVRLVDDFLDLRRLEEGKVKYDFKRTNIVQLTGDVIRELTPTAQQKQVRLDLVIDATRPWARVDPVKFRQVIQNIIDNACKYTDQGTVHVRIGNEGTNILISVADTGRGIPPAVLPRIFMQYVRDPSTEAAYIGSELGLYIAKQIVQAHHGDIWATSPGTNKGSTFFVRISSVR